MKKILALVLALVMTMSLVTISAGAKDFADADSITYEEAVDVMTAIGVVGGYADGSFNPKGTLTRGAAAKIICNMILGPTEAGALSTVEAPFADVPADHVFSGYIAYCVSEGIVSGYTDGTFRPAGTLTGYAFWKMLLGALGYDADIEGYTGANYAINVAKRALAIGLDEGLEGSFVGSKALTREEACLYAFNTLLATMVEYENASTITVGDIVISNNAKAKEIGYGVNRDILPAAVASTSTLQFCEKYFEKLDVVESKAADAFGRPAITWKWDKDEVGTYVTETPVLVYTEGFDATEKKALDDEYYFTGTKIMVNGIDDTSNIGSVANLAAREYTGTVIELYDTKDEGNIDLIVVVQGYLAQVADEDEDSISLDIYNPWASPIKGGDTFSDNTKKDDDTFDKLSAAYDEKDYLMVYYKGADLAKAYIKAVDVETATAKVKTIKVDAKMNGYLTGEDGTKYTFASGYMDNTALVVGNEYTLFLDENGYVIGSELVKAEAAALTDVYYVDHVWSEDKKIADETKTTWYAQLVSLDGTVSTVMVEALDKNDNTGDYTSYIGELVTISDKKWTYSTVTYKAGNDKFDLKPWDEFGSEDYAWDLYESQAFTGKKFEKTSTRIAGTAGTYRLNADTKYIFIEDTQADIAVKTYTGGVAYTWQSADVAKVITKYDSMVAAYVVIVTADATQAQTYSKDAIFVAADSTELGDGYRVQKVYNADGTDEFLNVAEAEYALGAGFYTYDTNEDGFVVLEDANLMTIASTFVWEDEEGAIEGATIAANALFEGLLTVDAGTYNVEDIEVSEAAFVDAHDTEASGNYTKTVSSLADLCKLVDDSKVGTVTLSLNVAKDGAVIIVVTDINAI